MSSNSTLEQAGSLISTAAQNEPTQVNVSKAGRTNWGAWIARLTIVMFGGFLAWFTWGHWGSFQIDNGREIYVPVAILQGKLLFRDIWYMYGPLAPYLQAFLFRVFGIHLTVLYFFGLALALGTSLLAFQIACQLELDVIPAMVAPLFFLSEAFNPFIFNIVFPYSYAASLGLFLGMAFLYFAIRHSREKRLRDLAIAALLVSLSVLAKQEFGIACIATLGFEVFGCYWIDWSFRGLRKNVLVCAAGLSPAVIVYGWFTWKLSGKAIFFDNWVATPGTYFMRTYGKFMVQAQGFRFDPGEILQAVGMTAAAMMLWFAIAALNALGIKKLKSQPLVSLMVLMLDTLLVGVSLFGSSGWAGALYPLLRQTIFPDGLFFLGVFFILQMIWKLWRTPAIHLERPEAVLGIYAILVSARVMMKLTPSLTTYSVFFNLPLFLIFVILLVRLARAAGRSLESGRRNVLITCMLGAEAVLIVTGLIPDPKQLPAPLTTELGTVYTPKDVSILFPQIISFMKSHTKNGKDILVLPEPPSLYVFAGMQSPTRWYSLLPGVVDPDHEQQYIDEVASNHVRYVLISNRIVTEYHVRGFANGGYNQLIYRWIMENYAKVGQFGPLPDAPYPPYTMWVYEKKGLAQEQN